MQLLMSIPSQLAIGYSGTDGLIDLGNYKTGDSFEIVLNWSRRWILRIFFLRARPVGRGRLPPFGSGSLSGQFVQSSRLCCRSYTFDLAHSNNKYIDWGSERFNAVADPGWIFHPNFLARAIATWWMSGSSC